MKVYLTKQSVGSVIPTGGTDVLCGSSTDVLGVGLCGGGGSGGGWYRCSTGKPQSWQGF